MLLFLKNKARERKLGATSNILTLEAVADLELIY